jgi:hypothetical protein
MVRDEFSGSFGAPSPRLGLAQDDREKFFIDKAKHERAQQKDCDFYLICR